MADHSSECPNRFRLLRGPAWVLSVSSGLPFGIVMGVYAGVVGGTGLAAAVITGLFAGVLFGLLVSLLLARTVRRGHPADDAVPAGQRRAVLRAAARGPVPADPAVREAALRLATQQLAQVTRFHRPAAVVLGLCTLLEAAAAVLYTGWLWVGTALFAAIMIVHLGQPGRLRRRIMLLRAG